MGNDGFSRKLVRFLTKEYIYEVSKTSKENRIENLPEVWDRVSQEEIWEQIRRLYSLESKEILFQTMQLYSSEWPKQRELSPFSEKVSEKLLLHLQKHGEFRCSPQGRELEKQRSEQFRNTLSFLPHEIALASKAHEKALKSFESYWRSESIKAGGNAIVPAVALEIFKAIQKYEEM